MICTSIIPDTVEEALEKLRVLEFAELRMEKLSLVESDVKRIFNRQTRIIATHRPSDKEEGRRAEILKWAIEQGASYVDLEIESGRDFIGPLVEKASEFNCRVIVSCHDFKTTPSKEELEKIVEKCFSLGADIAKITCMVQNGAEAARILGLADRKRAVIPLGMGEAGRITRIAAPLVGAPFTFAPFGEGMETAPGQISKEVLEKIYTLLDV